ncbi:MAG: 2-oxoglutaramate amidase [Flavobacterium sp. SCGC AAA160-P02]|nr:MAG: 2-oxoglutaramate amidase [Flavobacterium sp. SCGC AAA160-P02]
MYKIVLLILHDLLKINFMQNTLNIVGIQANIIWENPQANLISFKRKIDLLEGEVDLIILPEMFSTGFTMQPSLVAERMDGKTIRWMQDLANTKQVGIVGSLVIEENQRYFNRALFVHPDGQIQSYDKRHLFSLAGEDKAYCPGNHRVIVEFKGWRIFPLICYDIRFPVWSRFVDDYDLLLYMANWPTERIIAWDTLLKARAIENMSYCIGVNRVGKDANDYQYNGQSAVYDFLGAQLTTTAKEKEAVLSCVLNKTQQEEMREKLKFLHDKDKFKIK